MWNWIFSLAIIGVFYLFIGACVASCGKCGDKSKTMGGVVLNPLKIIAGSNQVASLSSFQMLFFTLIVLWLGIFWFLKFGTLVKPEGDLAILLGIAGSGTVLGKATDKTRLMLNQENFSWLRKKKWIQKDLIEGKYDDRKPNLFNLITTDGRWDISRFQAFGFTLLIGIALLWKGIQIDIPGDADTFEFSIGQTYLALIGASQGLYVGGKFSQKDSIKQLDVKLDQVCEKERAFGLAVSGSKEWQKRSNSPETQPKELLSLAQTCAPEAYYEFMYVAEEASNLVRGLTKEPVPKTVISPTLPPSWA